MDRAHNFVAEDGSPNHFDEEQAKLLVDSKPTIEVVNHQYDCTTLFNTNQRLVVGASLGSKEGEHFFQNGASHRTLAARFTE